MEEIVDQIRRRHWSCNFFCVCLIRNKRRMIFYKETNKFTPDRDSVCSLQDWNLFSFWVDIHENAVLFKMLTKMSLDYIIGFFVWTGRWGEMIERKRVGRCELWHANDKKWDSRMCVYCGFSKDTLGIDVCVHKYTLVVDYILKLL